MAPPLDYENEFTNAWAPPANVLASSTIPRVSSPLAGPAMSAAASPETELAGLPSIEATLAKEHLIKDILQLRDGLRGLLVRVTEVEKETDKLRKDNEFLGTYIDNLTRNSVVAAGQKR